MTTTLSAGTAELDITPPVGVDLTGYVAREGPSVGVHDRLFARALVLDDGRTRAALVACDLVGFTVALAATVRATIGDAIDIPVHAVMLTGTHTHSGPATIPLHGCGEIDPAYLASLPPRLIEVARQATANMTRVQVGAGQGAFPDGLFNRRRDGAPVDPGVGVACLRTPDGTTVATLVNYGCHPVVLDATNLHVSADYPGYLAAALQRTVGGMAFFLTGACGNADPVRRSSFEAAAWLGEALADEAIRTIRRMDFLPEPTLCSAAERIALPLQQLPTTETLTQAVADHSARLAQAEASGDSLAARVERAMVAWSKSTLAAVQSGEAAATMEADVQVLRIGPLTLAGIPGELFSTLGTQIKTGPPGSHIFIAGYANGDVGYIPSRLAYGSGGYEVNDAYKYYGYPAALAPEAGEAVVELASSLIQQCKE